MVYRGGTDGTSHSKSLDTKTGVYSHRKRVPKDLVSVVGSILLKTSLGTKDPAEAKVRYRERDLKVEARWSALRDGIRNGPIYLDDAQVEAIAGEIYTDYLARFGKVECAPAG